MMNSTFFILPTRFPRWTAAAPTAYLSRMTDTPSIRDVLDFWFLPLAAPEHGKPRKMWWEPTPELDADIRQRFSPAFERAIAGNLDHWRKSPDGALALIVL